jgi:hypothetical protein
VDQLNKFLANTMAVILSLGCLAGCNLGGPSKEEVTVALDAAMRAFTESVEEKTPEVENLYSNALDLIFRNDDESLIHHMNVLVGDADVTVYGDCEIEEYQDDDSDYLISGKLVYELLFPKNRFPNSGFGIMEGELTLSGGKVETIEFSLSVDEDGQLEEFLISANGKDIDLNEQDSMYNLLRQISRQLPG